MTQTMHMIYAGLLGISICATAQGQYCGDSTEDWKIAAEHDIFLNDFGGSISISRDLIAIGETNSNPPDSNEGAVHIYRFDGVGWSVSAEVQPEDVMGFNDFGQSVSLDDDALLVGALGVGFQVHVGGAFVFRNTDTGWVQESRLFPDVPGASDTFGSSVALEGDMAVVGAYTDSDRGASAGAVYVFGYNGSDWVREAKLTADDAESFDYFGWSVGISGDTIIAGAYLEDGAGFLSGSAYIFRREGTQWNQEAKLMSCPGGFGERFGFDVAISGDTAVVGVPNDDRQGTDTGSAYVFRRQGKTWELDSILLSNTGIANSQFATSVAVDGDNILVGAPEPRGVESAYLFRNVDEQWVQMAKLNGDDTRVGGEFGFRVSIRDGFAAVGAPRDDAVFIFRADCDTPCAADVNGDGVLDPTDFTAWMSAFDKGLPECDQNGDDACTPTDFTAWIDNFNVGC